MSTGIKGIDFMISNRLNGGLPCGRFNNIYGAEGTGKTLLAIKTAVECQKAGGIVFWFDSESALDKEWAVSLGLHPKTPTTGGLTVEETFAKMVEIITKFNAAKLPDTKLLIVWDSLAATATNMEMEADTESINKMMGKRPQILGFNLKKIAPLIRDHKVCVLILNQAITDINVRYGDPEKQPGGRAFQHWMTTIINLKKSNAETEKVDNNMGGEKEGVSIDVTALVAKNRMGPPKRKYKFTMNYLQGPQEHNTIREQVARQDPVEVDYQGQKLMFKLQRKGSWYKAMVFDPEKNVDADYNGETVKEVTFQKEGAGAKWTLHPEWQEVLD